MSTRRKSKVKDTLLKFIKTTKDGESFTFVVDGDKIVAANFIHRMRVELSRLREQVRQKLHKVPNHFKVYVENIEEYEVNENGKVKVKSKVTLMRTTGYKNLTPELEEALQDLVVEV